MSVKITDNSARLISERDNKVSLMIRFMLEGAHRFSTAGTPKKEGNLRADILKSVNGKSGTITWDKKYAAYQEKGRGISNYTTPGTGKNFARNAVKKVIQNKDNYLKQVGL